MVEHEHASPSNRRSAGVCSDDDAARCASSSTCSFTNHCRKLAVAWSFSAWAWSTRSWIRPVTFCSCAYAASNAASGVAHCVCGFATCSSTDLAVALEDEVVDLHRVSELLLRLDAHPVRGAEPVLRGEVRRHGEVKVGGVQFGVDLPVERLFHLRRRASVFPAFGRNGTRPVQVICAGWNPGACSAGLSTSRMIPTRSNSPRARRTVLRESVGNLVASEAACAMGSAPARRDDAHAAAPNRHAARAAADPMLPAPSGATPPRFEFDCIQEAAAGAAGPGSSAQTSSHPYAPVLCGICLPGPAIEPAVRRAEHRSRDPFYQRFR